MGGHLPYPGTWWYCSTAGLPAWQKHDSGFRLQTSWARWPGLNTPQNLGTKLQVQVEAWTTFAVMTPSQSQLQWRPGNCLKQHCPVRTLQISAGHDLQQQQNWGLGSNVSWLTPNPQTLTFIEGKLCNIEDCATGGALATSPGYALTHFHKYPYHSHLCWGEEPMSSRGAGPQQSLSCATTLLWFSARSALLRLHCWNVEES